ncbi:MAG TPA: hypothetical protein VGY54_22880 [Polyangiaceae bacterium]|jgi:hypothetical protein|nr:hypothetical protein [Polyangiaceae bacterium]
MSDARFEITCETTLIEIPRGRDAREALRVRFVEARTEQDKVVSWVDVRLFTKTQDGFAPTKKGTTVRVSELGAVITALRKVAEEHAAPAAAARTNPPTRRPEHRESSAAQPLLPDEQYARMRGRAS